MAVEGIGNSVQNVADQFFQKEQAKRAVPSTYILGRGNAGNGAVAEDTFTPSAQNHSTRATAQDAGIFQITQFGLTEIAANIPFDQGNSNAIQNEAPAQAATAATTAAGSGQTGAAQTPGTTENAPNQNTVASVEAGAGSPAATADVQVQLQALNAALPALGLTNAQIQQIDRIASLVHNFNPAAYANLVNQFEALAQETAQQNAPLVAATPGTTAPALASTGANGSSFQVREIIFHLTGVQGAANRGAANGGGQGSTANSAQSSATALQIDLVQFTLANSRGQTVLVQAPQQNTTAGTSNKQGAQNQVAAA